MKTVLRSGFIFVLFCILFPAFVNALGASANDLTIYSLKGPSGVGMIRLFEEAPELKGFNVKMEALAQSNLMAARFISGEAKVGILPPDVAAKIASQGRDIRAVAVIGAGMLSLLSSDPNVRNINDLRGKTVEAVGQGATPDYVFRRILRAHGLLPYVTLSYSLAYPEIAQSLIAGRVSNALLPEPFATMALMGNPQLRSVADIQEEWARAVGRGAGASGTGSFGTDNTRNYPMTVLVVDGAFASANPEALGVIIDAVKNSIEWVRANPVEAGVLVEKHDLGLKAAVAAAAIPKSNYVFIPAAEARPSLEELFTVFLENTPASIGGALPGEKFYWKMDN